MHATICDLITDLVHNSIEAEATDINLHIEETKKSLKVVITDNGKGMNAETIAKAKDPFWSDGRKHAHRKVGLGLPFLFQTVEATGGSAGIESEEGKGTAVTFQLDPEHMDLPEFGRFTTAATTLITYGFTGNLRIERNRNGNGYSISKKELEEALGDLNALQNLTLLKQFFEGNEDEIGG